MLKALIAAYHKRVIYNTTYNELNSLSEKELSDLGITRGQIHEVAQEATYGKAA